MSDSAGSLEILARKLRSHYPVSLAATIELFQAQQDHSVFIKLVREFLPERETEILRCATPGEKMMAFARYFEERYFPLPYYFSTGDAEEYGDLVSYLPLIPLGFSYQEYDELVMDDDIGLMLMSYFFRNPYGEPGARVPLAEACQQKVPVELLQRIPEPGYTPEELHRLLDHTPYQLLATWGDMINLSTNNDFLDIDQEMLDNSELPDWSRETVDYFTRQWAEAERLRHEVFAMAEKFNEQPAAYLREILDFIDRRKRELHGEAN